VTMCLSCTVMEIWRLKYWMHGRGRGKKGGKREKKKKRVGEGKGEGKKEWKECFLLFCFYELVDFDIVLDDSQKL